MISRDARRLPEAALEDLRRRAVAAVETGVSRTEVARMLGVSRKTVGNWVTSYRDTGEDAFRPRPRGRRPGEQLALSAAQQEATLKAIVGGGPEEVGLPYRVWARPAIAEFVNREFRIMLSVKTVSGYLIRWGLLPGPNVLELLRGPDPVRHRAAEVVWLAWTQQANPAAAVPDDLTGLNVLLAACNRGTLHFGVRREPFDSASVAGFLHRLADQVGHPLDVVVCRWPARHTAVVRSWPASPGTPITIRFAE